MKHTAKRPLPFLSGCTAVALSGTLAALAADVPWQFTGDDTRPAASVASAATPVSSFVSWTYDESIDESGAIAFSSAPPSFVLIMR